MFSWTSEPQPLVEVFGVRFLSGGEAPAGTVSVFDGKRGQIIYNGDRPSSRGTQISGDRLQLTGPYRAVSADGCVAFLLDLHLRRPHDPPSSTQPQQPTKIVVDVYNKATRYNELTTREDGRGAKVTYALLSNAAEAIVEVRLLGQRAGRTVRGTVVAQTDLGVVVLFDGDGVTVGTGTTEEPTSVVPLNRSVVAVRLASLLTVEVKLVIDGDGEDSVVKESVNESVACVPKLGGEDVQQCGPTAGAAAVEVKITWLD